MNPPLRAVLAAHGYVITSSQARDCGLTPHMLRSMTRQGALVALTRGAYADGDKFRTSSPEARHLLRARAVLGVLPHGIALSHHSAAVAWGLPWVGGVPSRVTLVRVHEGQHRRTRDYTIHRTIAGAEIADLTGVPVIEPAVAIVGVAAQHGLKACVVALDAALHTGLVDRSRVEAALRKCRGWPGREVAASAATLADEGAESPGETLTRLLLHTLGYPVRSQMRITARDGFRARVDFMLKDAPVIIEFDGAVKYGGRDGHANRGALIAEKVREDRLRSLGYEVVRLTWSDLERPERVRELVDAALRRAAQAA